MVLVEEDKSGDIQESWLGLMSEKLCQDLSGKREEARSVIAGSAAEES